MQMPDTIKDIARTEDLRRMGAKATKELYPQTQRVGLTEKEITIATAYGNPSTHHFFAFYSGSDGEVYPLNARCYNTPPSTYKGSTSPCEKAYKSLKFLHDAGINVPKAIMLPESSNWLFTEYIPGQALSEVIHQIRKQKNPEKTVKDLGELMEKMIAQQVNFQLRTTSSAEALNDAEKEVLFWARAVPEQVRDYLEVMSRERDLDRNVGLYLGLFRKGLEGNAVCHGDLSPDNIIRTDDGDLSYIDPELKRRNEFSDVGSFLAYLGETKSLDSVARFFRSRKMNEMLTFSADGRTQLSLAEEEAKKSIYYALYSNLSFYSHRIIAKRKRRNEPEEEYEAQIRNVFHVLNSFIENPSKFQLSVDNISQALALKKRLGRGPAREVRGPIIVPHNIRIRGNSSFIAKTKVSRDMKTPV